MHATIFVFDIFSVISKEVHTSHRKKIIAGNSVVSCDVFCDKSQLGPPSVFWFKVNILYSISVEKHSSGEIFGLVLLIF